MTSVSIASSTPPQKTDAWKFKRQYQPGHRIYLRSGKLIAHFLIAEAVADPNHDLPRPGRLGQLHEHAMLDLGQPALTHRSLMQQDSRRCGERATGGYLLDQFRQEGARRVVLSDKQPIRREVGRTRGHRAVVDIADPHRVPTDLDVQIVLGKETQEGIL